MTEGGRIIIPADFRGALGLDIGDEVILDLGEDKLTLMTARPAVRGAQELVRKHVPEGYRLVDELISERRAEANRFRR